jgi:hypothetical protein
MFYEGLYLCNKTGDNTALTLYWLPSPGDEGSIGGLSLLVNYLGALEHPVAVLSAVREHCSLEDSTIDQSNAHTIGQSTTCVCVLRISAAFLSEIQCINHMCAANRCRVSI